MNPKFRAAVRYARTIPEKINKRSAIRHLFKLMRAALGLTL